MVSALKKYSITEASIRQIWLLQKGPEEFPWKSDVWGLFKRCVQGNKKNVKGRPGSQG